MSLLALLAGCADDAVERYYVGDCLVPETSGDATAWHAWAEEQRAEFEATGTCPTEPPAEAVMEDGCRYATDAYVFPSEAAIKMSVRFGMEDAFLATRLYLEGLSWLEEGGGCHTNANPQEEGDYTMIVDWTELGQVEPPMFFSSPEGYYRSNSSSAYAVIGGDSASFWVCLEEFAPLSGPHYGPTEARGSAFFHVEEWASLGLPVDIFLPVDHDDCAYAENAYGPICPDGNDPCFYPSDCDGVDNDLDGEIDDFGNDWDGDGVVNCE